MNTEWAELFDLPTSVMQERLRKVAERPQRNRGRDPEAQCFACGQSWSIHSDDEWANGCRQRQA